MLTLAEVNSILELREYESLVASMYSTESAELASFATHEDPSVRHAVFNNPNTPPAVKLWLQTAYGQMSLEEFLNAVDSSR